MKKLSLLLGTIGGAMAGYVFSKSELRAELSGAKNAEDAAKILGKHLSKDGKKVGTEMMAFVDSPEVQKNMKKAKQYAETQFSKAKKEVGALIMKSEKQAMKAVKKATKKAKKA